MRFFSHLKTVIRHKNAVFLHCCKAGIPVRGFLHDLSKFSPVEFLNGVKYYQGTRSPNEEEREENGYSLAWMHHKGRNRHHFEYWIDVNPVSKRYEPVEMPRKYLIEMFCDRVAASKIYKGKDYTDDAALIYFERAKHKRVIHQKTSDELEFLLRMLAEKGEREVFFHIKSHKNKELI